VRTLGAHQYVLESDAPYFAPPGTQLGHPHYLGEVAQEVAEVRGVAPEVVVRESHLTASHLYG